MAQINFYLTPLLGRDGAVVDEDGTNEAVPKLGRDITTHPISVGERSHRISTRTNRNAIDIRIIIGAVLDRDKHVGLISD